ncbi:hypothetical protein HZR84_02325 [Hyphobacterium sp. CCMP332]|nr:hypothetical protein HZR84_02325 [Hyphobacterium sp. CCMP332]
MHNFLKNQKYSMLLIALVIVISSCGRGVFIKKSIQGSPLNASVDLRLFWNDFEYIGEIDGTISYTQYVWGTRRYHEPRFNNLTRTTFLTFNGRSFLPIQNAPLSRALYDAQEKYPDLEFIIPYQVNEEIQRMFLGRKITINVKAKAYKLKQN